MKTVQKTVWRMGVRNKKDWSKWMWGKQYDSFEELINAASPYLKANPGIVTRIITEVVYVPVAE